KEGSWESREVNAGLGSILGMFPVLRESSKRVNSRQREIGMIEGTGGDEGRRWTRGLTGSVELILLGLQGIVALEERGTFYAKREGGSQERVSQVDSLRDSIGVVFQSDKFKEWYDLELSGDLINDERSCDPSRDCQEYEIQTPISDFPFRKNNGKGMEFDGECREGAGGNARPIMGASHTKLD
ncbi:hypothetical protein EDB86DRAFT_2836480, partial [Lactarius hatsudake]